MPLHHPISLSLSRNIAGGGFVSGSGLEKYIRTSSLRVSLSLVSLCPWAGLSPVLISESQVQKSDPDHSTPTILMAAQTTTCTNQFNEDLRKFRKVALGTQECGSSEQSGPTSSSSGSGSSFVIRASLVLTIWVVLLSSHCVGAKVEHYWMCLFTTPFLSLSLSGNMAGGGFVFSSSTEKAYPGKFTRNVVVTCIVASIGWFIFDYDIGSSVIQNANHKTSHF
ncbi:hypothetical protein RHMOL_Rhmol02G0276300 [Rhododendron molle]|uniref:Uncharacterized protein n=1 Tax=Rhododendron molle TaxID=49168 RepID=A0ACC0PWL2_RHOML|nr:hypothetical protein RHMOL_Rhmol02G0276300 [Rhododendron molle]